MKSLQHVDRSALLFFIGLGILPLMPGCAKQVTGGGASQQQVKPAPTAAAMPPASAPAEAPRIEPVAPPPLAPPPKAPRAESVPLPAPPAPVEAHKPEMIPPPPLAAPEERVTEVVPPPPVPAPLPPPAVPTPAPAAAAPTLSDIFFDYDQSALRVDARSALEHNAHALKNGIAGAFVIEGHCDERGTHAYNMVLGERRAQAVKRYLEDLGVGGDRIKIVSYGKERPFCTDHSEACWQENRRAHFVPR